jgi:hypothetical protein
MSISLPWLYLAVLCVVTVSLAQCDKNTNCGACIAASCGWCQFTESCVSSQTQCQNVTMFKIGSYSTNTVNFTFPCTSFTRVCVPYMTIAQEYPSQVLYQIRPFAYGPMMKLPVPILGRTDKNLSASSNFGVYIYSGPVSPMTRVESSAQGGLYLNGSFVSFPDLLFTGTGVFKFGFVVELDGTCWSVKSNKDISTKPVSSLIYEYPMTWVGIALLCVTFPIVAVIGRFCPFKMDKTDTLLGKDSGYHKATYTREPNRFLWILHMSREDMVRAIGEESYFLWAFRFLILLFMVMILSVNFLILMPLDGIAASEGDLARFSPASIPTDSLLMYGHLSVMIFVGLLLVGFGVITRFVIPILKTKDLFPSDFTIKFSYVHDFEAFKEFLTSLYGKESFQAIWPVYDLNAFADAVKKDASDSVIDKARNKSKFTGIVYATFNHTSLAINCLSKKEAFKTIRMEKAEEPDDIIWRNQPVTNKEKWSRVFVD